MTAESPGAPSNQPWVRQNWAVLILYKRDGFGIERRCEYGVVMGTQLYPPIEPYVSGMLDVSDGNSVYWECSGTPDGVPALAVHGGPGSGCVPGMRRPFNPERYRIVSFDQRGCGRSTPHASDPTVDLSTNTTDHLIADMEALRTHVGVHQWVLVVGNHLGPGLRPGPLRQSQRTGVDGGDHHQSQ